MISSGCWWSVRPATSLEPPGLGKGSPAGCVGFTRRNDLEAAPRALAARAALAHGRFDELGEQRLHRAAHLRPSLHGGRQQTAEPAYADDAVDPLHLVRRAKLLQQCRRALDAFRDRAVRSR